MSDAATFVFGLISGALIGAFITWIAANGEIKEECLKLNSFYVGSSVFKCELKRGEWVKSADTGEK